MCYELIELKDGEPVVFLGVHVLRWDWSTMGEPSVGFIDCDCHMKVEELQVKNERLVAALEHSEQTLRNLGNGMLTGDAKTIALNEARNICNALAAAKGSDE